MTLASGDLADMMKLLCYAQDLEGNMYLMQAVVVKGDARLDVSLKTDASSSNGGDPAEAFIDKMSQALVAIGML